MFKILAVIVGTIFIGMMGYGLITGCIHAWSSPQGWSTIASKEEVQFAENLFMNAMLVGILAGIFFLLHLIFGKEETV